MTNSPAQFTTHYIPRIHTIPYLYRYIYNKNKTLESKVQCLSCDYFQIANECFGIRIYLTFIFHAFSSFYLNSINILYIFMSTAISAKLLHKSPVSRNLCRVCWFLWFVLWIMQVEHASSNLCLSWIDLSWIVLYFLLNSQHVNHA